VEQQDRLRRQQALGLDVDRHLLADLIFRETRRRQNLDALGRRADLRLRGVAVITQIDAPAIRARLQQIRRRRVARVDRRRADLHMEVVVGAAIVADLLHQHRIRDRAIDQ
jgi:hypothetical protein